MRCRSGSASSATVMDAERSVCSERPRSSWTPCPMQVSPALVRAQHHLVWRDDLGPDQRHQGQQTPSLLPLQLLRLSPLRCCRRHQELLRQHSVLARLRPQGCQPPRLRILHLGKEGRHVRCRPSVPLAMGCSPQRPHRIQDLRHLRRQFHHHRHPAKRRQRL